MVLRLELALAGGSISEIRAWSLRVGELVSAGVLEPVNLPHKGGRPRRGA